ncbi:PREDICTED: 3-epi-6-deoxocathasterone 23-monooxygenase-like isoform X2 [Nelumbo nucifera]|uniref:3-epi-6-deoxocathasterone 23-monooxygenase-like isoform X2 n=1 Tax=Nelumbo nucifera TaxID=4432 RepID=A0A1U8BFG2_NELNU|nr:PREDICTED: 3-epi-6-deoxocathasterone 23-monooxygenase-like isoform X2 [Nelumbo nucifera]
MKLVLAFWVLVGFIGWCWWKKKKKKKEKEQLENQSGIPKGTLGWPLIGETLNFIASGYTSRPVSFMEKRKSLYGNVFKSHILGMPIIISTDPDVNKVILQNNGSIFVPFYPKSITELLGKSSILQMNGNLQKRVHGLIGGFFRSPQLKVRITREIENAVNKAMEAWRDGDLVYMQEETRNITFQVLVRVLMSVGPGEDLQFLKREFGEFIKGLVCLPIKLPGTRLYKSLKAKERLLKMVKRIVEERKMRMESIDERGPLMDAIDVLLCDAGETEDKQHLPLDFISGNIIEMMIPGEDSVPMLMTLAVNYLSESPLALKQLEENMELKRQKTQLGEDYAWTDYMSLPFTQNVINETLRMANIINGVWRKVLRDIEIKGYFIPKGWCVLASFISVHMNEENYENTNQFDPWRWQRKGGNINNNYCFTPFGGGQRLCPGLELSRLEVSIFLHHLVTRFRWVAEEDYIVHFPTVKMKRKLPVFVTPISS